MQEINLNQIIREVRKTYKAFEDELNERIKANSETIKHYNTQLTNIESNIDNKEKEIKNIKDDNNNYYCGNNQFSLLIEKERVIKIKEKEIEDLKNEKVNLKSLIQDLKEDLIMQNNEDNRTIEKLNNEKEKIIRSLIDRQLYDQNIRLVVDNEELTRTILINDNMANEE